MTPPPPPELIPSNPLPSSTAIAIETVVSPDRREKCLPLSATVAVGAVDEGRRGAGRRNHPFARLEGRQLSQIPGEVPSERTSRASPALSLPQPPLPEEPAIHTPLHLPTRGRPGSPLLWKFPEMKSRSGPRRRGTSQGPASLLPSAPGVARKTVSFIVPPHARCRAKINPRLGMKSLRCPVTCFGYSRGHTYSYFT